MLATLIVRFIAAVAANAVAVLLAAAPFLSWGVDHPGAWIVSGLVLPFAMGVRVLLAALVNAILPVRFPIEGAKRRGD